MTARLTPDDLAVWRRHAVVASRTAARAVRLHLVEALRQDEGEVA
jgi:hypothetical protein